MLIVAPHLIPATLVALVPLALGVAAVCGRWRTMVQELDELRTAPSRSPHR